MGYHRAGFEVVGVDIKKQPRYPFQFIQADAMRYMEDFIAGDEPPVEAIHASPPCQYYSYGSQRNGKTYPNSIAQTRDLLDEIGLPYVIENVEGAPLFDSVILCGASEEFPNLRVIRHRRFESNVELVGTKCPPEHPKVFTYDKRRSQYGQLDPKESYHGVYGGGKSSTIAREAMGINWPMSRKEVNEAVPPDYTEYIGKQLIRQLGRDRGYVSVSQQGD